jgi:hypothetical protein
MYSRKLFAHLVKLRFGYLAQVGRKKNAFKQWVGTDDLAHWMAD